MPSHSCTHCLEWTTSEKAMEDALKGRWRARQRCPHQPLMQTAIEQFRKGVSAWWVVGGAVVVPIWTVEILKKRARLVMVPHPASQTFLELH